MKCSWCKEPVLPAEQDAYCKTMHYECAYRAVMGSVAHIERRCSCYVAGSTEGDDPALTKRQAAKAAFAAAVEKRRDD